MSRRHERTTAVTVCAAVILVAVAAPSPAESLAAPSSAARQASDPGLERALARLVDAFPGRAGVAVRHVTSRIGAEIDAATPYPMASTYKVPILVEMMARVEAGDMTLDDEIELRPADQHIGSGLLQDLWAPGMTLSLRNLATMMIILSDNSATDMMIDRLGAAAITSRMRALGYENIRVDRTTLELILDYIGVPYEGLEDADLPAIQRALAAFEIDRAEREAAAEAFYDDGLDTASARDMTDLLVRLARRELLKGDSCDVVIEILERTQTGADRLRGLLPSGITLAHKTGTIGRVVNDVGIVTLPDDLGQFAISVYTLGAEGTDSATNERLIADLARTSYDYFQFR